MNPPSIDMKSKLTLLTRLGFAARGLLYIVIATLVLRTGRTEDPGGALNYLAQGNGRWLVLVMAAGFIAYGIWRLSDGLFNIEQHPASGKGIRERIAASASGVVHLTLAWQAIRLGRGAPTQQQDGAQEGAATALSMPGGEMALILGGVILLGVGLFQLIKAAKQSYLRHLEPGVANRVWAKWTGRIGYAARGLVFLIIGYFLLRAGLDSQATKAGDMAKALDWLTSPWDVLVAVGLLGFGLFSLIEARFRVLNDVPIHRLAR